MTSQPPQPVTPVRVPKAATAYTPTTQDPELRSQINTLLLREGHVEKIEQTLHQALHAHPSNWPAKISLHALALLRSGECNTFPKLMERVLADVRRDTEAAAAANAAAAGVGGEGSLNTSLGGGVGVGGKKKGGDISPAGMTTTSGGLGGSGGSSPDMQRKAVAVAAAGAVKANGAASGATTSSQGKGKGKGKAATGGTTGVVNGVVMNGIGPAGGGSERTLGGHTTGSLAVPQTVIEEGIRITRECLEQVCEVDE